MILSQLQHYLAEQKKASLAQMETKFGIDATALQGMLNHLVHKGRVRKSPSLDCCHGCEICATKSLEFYEWATWTEELTLSHCPDDPCGMRKR